MSPLCHHLCLIYKIAGYFTSQNLTQQLNLIHYYNLIIVNLLGDHF